MNKNAIIILLVVAIAIGAYMWKKDQDTTTIDLPGDNTIEITK